MRKKRTSHSRNARMASRRERRSWMGELFLGPHDRASAEVNRRGCGRRNGMTRQAAIAGSAETFEDDFEPLTWAKRFLYWSVALILIPFCFVTIITILQQSGEEKILSRIWYSTEFLCFLVGVGSMISWFVAGIGTQRLLYLYVLGHEMTHAAFVYACFGRISAIHFSTEGGYVMTSKSNILIALSPYFVPFWSAVVISLHGLISLWAEIPASELIMTGLLGLTWSFHIIWTVWMIPKDQPDLKEHGFFLSLMVIIFANLVLLSVMYCATSREVKLVEFGFGWWNNCLDLAEGTWRVLYGVIAG